MVKVNVEVVSKNPKYNQYEKKIQQKYQQTVFKAVNMVRNTVIDGIRAGGQGEVYEKYNPRRTHQSSKEGAYPATDTGFLISHVNSKIYNNGLGGEIQSNAEYSAFLEFGTRTMRARPFMQPSLEVNRKKIVKMFMDFSIRNL
jgi:HK97 gp10 family phage protein